MNIGQELKTTLKELKRYLGSTDLANLIGSHNF